MALRDRQIGGIPLVWNSAFALTLFLALCIPVIGHVFWFPLFGIPEEFRIWISLLSIGVYIGQCSGVVKAGTEQVQLFFGQYTGISFRAGFYLLPKIPFPIIALLLRIFFGENVYQHLGWILENAVRVESIVVTFSSEGLTSDGIRASTEGTFVFEIENVAVYLSQSRDDTDRSSLIEALRSEASSRIKSRVIAKYTAKELLQGEYQGGADLAELITDACSFIEDFGLRLSRAPIVSMNIKSERIQKAFDADNAKDLLRRNTNEVAEAFKEFRGGLPKDTSEEVAFMLFNAARIDEGVAPITMANIKVK